MTTDRASSAAERFALKAVTAQSLSQAGGEHMSPYTRKSPAQLYRYGKRNDPNYAPLDVVLELDRMAEQPIITAQLAAFLGFRLVAVDSRDDRASLTDLVSDFIGETSDVSRTVLQADADGEITPRERKAILKEIREAQDVITRLRRQIGGAANG